MLEQSRNELATAAAEAESAADTYKSEAKQLKEKVRRLSVLAAGPPALLPSLLPSGANAGDYSAVERLRSDMPKHHGGPCRASEAATQRHLCLAARRRLVLGSSTSFLGGFIRQPSGQPLLLSSSTSVRPTSARLPPSINIVWKSEDLAPHTASWSAAKLRDMYAAGSAMVRVDVMWEYLMKERSLRGLAEETCRVRAWLSRVSPSPRCDRLLTVAFLLPTPAGGIEGSRKIETKASICKASSLSSRCRWHDATRCSAGYE